MVKTGRQYGFAKILEIIKPSEHREKPACPIYNQCGGCSLQHMSYKQQLQQKTILVEDNLRRIGKIEHAVIHPTLGMKDPWRYRNKAQVPIGEEEGGLIGGFYAARSHQIINMESCLIQHEKNDELIEVVKKIASSLGIHAYHEETGKGLLRHVVVKYGFKTGELMVVLVINGNKLINKEELVNQLVKKVDGLKSIVVNINRKKQTSFLVRKRVCYGENLIFMIILAMLNSLYPLARSIK